jgi:hypothetical protein
MLTSVAIALSIAGAIALSAALSLAVFFSAALALALAFAAAIFLTLAATAGIFVITLAFLYPGFVIVANAIAVLIDEFSGSNRCGCCFL